MASQVISCGECSWPIPAEFWNLEGGSGCSQCGRAFRVTVFPAIEQRRVGALPESLGAETEASCFYHPQSRAAVPCEECGRFLCQLCDLETEGRHLCPVCFQTGLSTRKLETMESRRVLYDTLALALATFPALLFWPAFVCAPMALFIVVRRWRSPGSILPRTRIRYYLAVLLALAEIAAIVFVILLILRVPRNVPSP